MSTIETRCAREAGVNAGEKSSPQTASLSHCVVDRSQSVECATSRCHAPSHYFISLPSSSLVTQLSAKLQLSGLAAPRDSARFRASTKLELRRQVRSEGCSPVLLLPSSRPVPAAACSVLLPPFVPYAAASDLRNEDTENPALRSLVEAIANRFYQHIRPVRLFKKVDALFQRRGFASKLRAVSAREEDLQVCLLAF